MKHIGFKQNPSPSQKTLNEKIDNLLDYIGGIGNDQNPDFNSIYAELYDNLIGFQMSSEIILHQIPKFGIWLIHLDPTSLKREGNDNNLHNSWKESKIIAEYLVGDILDAFYNWEFIQLRKDDLTIMLKDSIDKQSMHELCVKLEKVLPKATKAYNTNHLYDGDSNTFQVVIAHSDFEYDPLEEWIY